MKKIARLCVIPLVAASPTFAANDPMVGGQEMFPTKNIVQNAMNSGDHITLVAAVKAAGLGGRFARSWGVHRVCAYQ